MNTEVTGLLVAAHELKAPLSLVRQLALNLDFSADAAEKSRLATEIVSVSERALRQVNDLTKLARLEDGLFETAPVSVRGICDEVLREVGPLFEKEQRALDISYINRSRLAVANHDLLFSVVYNFLTNALHYSDRTAASRLKIRDFKNQIQISVRDFGPALPTPIWRELKNGGLVRPTKISMRPGSSGLGLYIASEFARFMHARLGAVRHADGTSFFIELPISKQAELAL